jgi:hypothetical protein
MRTCEHCGGLSVSLRLVEGKLICKACRIQAEREAARGRHPAGKRSVNRQSA